MVDDLREKVIRELEKEVAEGSVPCKPKGYMFPFKLIKDALSLLKAQEPRAMTLDEVQKISTEDLDGVVWLESRMYCDPDNGDCDIWFSGWANPVESCETDIHLYAFGNEVPVEAKKRWYGKTWRCWTSRPTDEQRMATPWQS